MAGTGRGTFTSRFLVILTLFGLAIAPAAKAAPRPIVFYVSPAGNDHWRGMLPSPNGRKTNGPFATLQRAEQAVRTVRQSASNSKRMVEVWVRGGTYYLTQPLQLNAMDSGTGSAPTVFRAYRREKPVLIGGIRLNDFKPYRGAIVQCDLKPYHMAQLNQLFFRGKRQIPARWPNYDPKHPRSEGWAYIAGVSQSANRNTFVYDGDRPDRWSHPQDGQVCIWPNWNWWYEVDPIKGINTDRHTITLQNPLDYSAEPGRRFFVQGIFEELDAPGEWYLNPRTDVLYFWPPSPIHPGDVIAPRLNRIIEVQNANHLIVRGFTIEDCEGTTARLHNCRHCVVAGCTITNCGGWGINIEGGVDNGAVGNDVFDTGLGGIQISGGDRATLTPAGNYADDNDIYHFACIHRTYEPGIGISGVGNRITHNLIHDAPHAGILLSGNDHLIEYNDIHDVCQQGGDNGAFYMGRDWTQRGIIIRFNKFHDIYGYGLANPSGGPDHTYTYESPLWAWGIYLDDATSGIHIYGNVIYRAPLCAVMLGGGRNNRVENNIIVNCIPALHIDARWSTFEWPILIQRYQAMNADQPPYSTRYPHLDGLLQRDYRLPANNVFDHNVVAYRSDDYCGLSTMDPQPAGACIYDLTGFNPSIEKSIDYNTVYHYGQPIRVSVSGAGRESWRKWQQTTGFDRHSIVANPEFVDPAHRDYQLRPGSPAYREGFQRIPYKKIGLYKSPLRASWPGNDQPRDTRHITIFKKTIQITPR